MPYDDYFTTQTVNVKTNIKSKELTMYQNVFAQQHPFIMEEHRGSYLTTKKVILGMKTPQMQSELGVTATRGYIDAKPFSQSSTYRLLKQGVGAEKPTYISSKILGRSQDMGFFFRGKEAFYGMQPTSTPTSSAGSGSVNVLSSVSKSAGSIIATQKVAQTSGLSGVIPVVSSQQKETSNQGQSLSVVSQSKQQSASLSQVGVVSKQIPRMTSVEKVITLPAMKESQRDKQVLISASRTKVSGKSLSKQFTTPFSVLSQRTPSETTTKQNTSTITVPVSMTSIRSTPREKEFTREDIITKPQTVTTQVTQQKYFIPAANTINIATPKPPKTPVIPGLPLISFGNYKSTPIFKQKKQSKPSPYIKYSPDLTATFFNIKKKIDVEKEKKKKWSPFKLRPIPL